MAKTKRTIDEAQDELVEDSVSDNVDTSPVEGMSKTNAMSVMMKGLADADDWVAFFNAVQAQVGQHSKVIPDGAGAKNAASTNMKAAIKEDLEALFGDSKELSEEFKTKAYTLFESAVNARVAAVEIELQEQYAEALEEEVSEIEESVIAKIDSYLSYVTEQWAEDNAVAIEKSIRADLAESFVEKLGQLFVEHNYNIPEESIEVADMLADKLDTLEEEYNKVVNENIELSQNVELLVQDKIINDLSDNLTVIEKEKFKTLVEGFEIEDVDEYVSKLETIKEHHFGKKSTTKTGLITEEIIHDSEEEPKDEKSISDAMKPYVAATKKLQRSY